MTETDRPPASTLKHTELVDLAREYTNVEKRGKFYWLTCPCCHRQDQMYIDRQKQLYHCFGCGEGGDAVTFQGYFE